jgi:predicted dehydrogenase
MEANYSIAKKLTDLVKVHGVRNVVGLQGSYSKVVSKVNDLIRRGEIGTVYSSILIGLPYGLPAIPSNIDYFTDKKVGGNALTIAFGHAMEFVKDGNSIPEDT